MSFSVDRIDHVEVFVRDLEAAAHWYREVLGLEEERRWNPEPVMIGVGGTKLALFQAKPGTTSLHRDAEGREDQSPRWRRVAWQVDAAGFEAAQRHLQAQEVPFEGPIQHGQQARSIYFEDPDGNPLEITTYRVTR